METPWHMQLVATLRRNFLIKIRDASQTFQEIFLPVYIIALLVFVKLLQPETNIRATPWQPKVDALCQPTMPGSQSVCQNLNRRIASETLLAYTPQGNGLVDEFILEMVHEFGKEYESPALIPRSFTSEDDLVDYYKSNPGTIYAALILEDVHSFVEFPKDLYFRIRINGTYVPSAQERNGQKDECRQGSYKCSANDYLASGFLALQSAVLQAVEKMAFPKSPCSQKKHSKLIFVQQQPLPPYHLSFASTMFQLFTAMYMVWALVPQLQTVLYHIVKEKEDLVKDCMLVMGLRESVYWTSWLLTYATMSAFTSLILVLAAKITTLFAMSDTRMVFLLIYFYSLSLISMAFALSTIFSKVKTAITISGALMILGSFTIIPVDLLHWSPTICTFLSLFSPIGLALAMNVIVRAEGIGNGLNLHDLWSTSVGTDPGDNSSHLSVGTIICILGIDAVFYILIAWYLDNAWPHPERGSKRPWSFVISKDYWSKSKESIPYSICAQTSQVSRQQSDDPSFEINTAIDMSEDVESNEACKDENSNIEQVDPSLTSKVVVKLQNLRKVYSSRKKWWEFWSFDHARSLRTKRQVQREVEAVKGLNLNLYEGECFAIAGHSGSGKSSIIYMLSRLSSCTSGEAYIYGLPITTGGTELKSIISVCPKSNICIGLLTAREQLEYFGTIKGKRWDFSQPEGRKKKSVKLQIDELLRELNLSEEADKQARYLSPSARRKLSLAMALIGDPQVVLMDQPTADLDLDSKKQFWNLIHKLQNQFLFVFTTDSMEEADVVADRKAILSHGVLKCCGSSLFLRKRFGLSYSLHITKGENYNSERILRLIQSHIADAVSIHSPNGQAHSSFRIPLGSSAQMASLLMDLTTNSAELGVGGGDLEATTLEEIFMKFQDEGEDEAASMEHISDGRCFENADSESESLLGDKTSRLVDQKISVLKMQILALLSTRFYLYRRNIGSTMTTVGLPLVLTLVVLIVQLWIGKSSPTILNLFDRRIGHGIPLYYTTHNKSSVSDAQFLLDKLGSNHVLLDETSLFSRFDVLEGPVNQRSLDAIGISFDQLDVASCSLQYTVMYQPWRTHQLPIVAAMINNAFLQMLHVNYSGKPPLNVHVGNHPLPYYNGEAGLSLMVVFVTTMGLLLIPPILGAQVVLDKQLGLLNLFRISGMRSLAYWVATFLTDIVLLYVASMVTVILGVSFGFSPFLKEAIPIIMLLMVVILPALLLLSYVLSFMFNNAQGAMSMLSLFFLLIAIIPYFIIIIIPGGLSSAGWHLLFSIIDPAYALISSLHMVVSSIDKIKGQNGLMPSSASTVLYFFRWNGYIILSVLGSAVSILLLLLCLWQLESHISSPELRDAQSQFLEEGSDSSRQEQEPEDIQQEKERVLASLASWENPHSGHNSEEFSGEPILCCHLSKKFKTSAGANNSRSDEEKWAVENIWLAVQQGEIVVLVGGEKAGKSTLLHCLGRETPITSGDALIKGNSVRYNFWMQQNIIGFCPQFELMYQSLTLREHLKLFASLKGLANPHNIPVEAILNALHLTEEADKRIRQCKASTHRKLAVATAMLGDPSVLLLDEPTYGLDMASRRKVRTCIAAQSNTRATLICTQSFEEAEALGKRVGILVNGQLKCLADPQELKRRYGSSYSLLVVAEPDKVQAMNKFISTLFAGLQEEINQENNNSNRVMGQWEQRRFQIPIRNLSELAMLLHELEAKRCTFGIKDYVVSQPTLQQVFYQISHAREGTDHT